MRGMCALVAFDACARTNSVEKEGKERKKNAQSQESLLTVFSLCANYVPPFLIFSRV